MKTSSISNLLKKIELITMIPYEELWILVCSLTKLQQLQLETLPKRCKLILINNTDPEQLTGCEIPEELIIVTEHYYSLPKKHKKILEQYSLSGALIVV